MRLASVQDAIVCGINIKFPPCCLAECVSAFVDTNNERRVILVPRANLICIARTYVSKIDAVANNERPRLRLPLELLYDVLIKSYFYVLLRSLRRKHCLD